MPRHRAQIADELVCFFAHRTESQTLPKSTIYFTVASLNRDLEFAIERLGQLRDHKFRREPIDAIIAKLEELRCWTNSEFLEVQVEREEKEIGRWEKLSRAYDATWEDPNDVLLEADRIRRDRTADQIIQEVERRQRAAKKKPAK
ncbi:MAG: hypothetical protein PW792_15730 [Acidobacteriaceae bacterium]|nr:hypothetical protein [Acidobacteriaceae bacterium]